MSHFSRIKTTIRNLNILQKTLSYMDLDYQCGKYEIKDYDGNTQLLDILIKGKNDILYGFILNNTEYVLVADLQLWNQPTSIEKFMDTVTQLYAYNMIVDQSCIEGFKCISNNVERDGSINLVIQRWNY